MKKEKLLFVISQFYKGGAEVSLLNLLKRIDSTKYDVDLMVMNQCPAEGAVDIISELPKNVKVIDVYRQNKNLSIVAKTLSKLLFTSEDLEKFASTALQYAREHTYDWAFHIGEWWSPEFVARKVKATRKAVWIHTDISLASSFQSEEFFRFADFFDRYIFVSKKSMVESSTKFSFLNEKSTCIYNICDVDTILCKSTQRTTDGVFDVPVVLTCANIRKEKNHRRQVDAMKLLKDRGVAFKWVNIGSTADTTGVNELRSRIKECGLEKDFLLLGPRENPYPYIRSADIVAVLSDYESWSMVITEAKILGTPIIATKTSGALEQIEDGKTGVLTDFTAKDIADKLEHLILNSDFRNEIRKNIAGFDNTDDILDDFYRLLNSKQEENVGSQKLLYVIDDINYQGGAHVATKNLICSLLANNHDITIFSGVIPTVKARNDLRGVKFFGWQQCNVNKLFYSRLADCLSDPTLSKKAKKLKLTMTWESKVRKNPNVFDEYVKRSLSDLFSEYDTVCVMSESSAFRTEVAKSSTNRKIQYIHTDYAAWCALSDWSRMITANDAEIYAAFNKIVLLSEGIQKRFVEMYPQLEEKTVVNQNLLLSDDIRKKAEPISPKGVLINLVTVGRIDHYKGFDRTYNVFQKLYDEGYQFHWTIIGDGEDFWAVKNRFAQHEYANCITMTGSKENPFREMKKADVFALFSQYEGLPNTIYEAMILGLPVIATNVGGIASQISVGENGWLVDNDEEAIYQGLKHIFENPQEVAKYKENLANYCYKNDEIIERTEQIIFGGE